MGQIVFYVICHSTAPEEQRKVNDTQRRFHLRSAQYPLLPAFYRFSANQCGRKLSQYVSQEAKSFDKSEPPSIYGPEPTENAVKSSPAAVSYHSGGSKIFRAQGTSAGCILHCPTT
jgi:hypothetical protein